MVSYFGDYSEDSTVYIPFNTFSSNDPQASVTITNLTDSDLHVHKDGGLTQIVTDGATVTINFDGITGNHLVTIDTSVHADYSIGSDYIVRMEGATVDGGTINAWIGSFSIENRFNEVAVVTWNGVALGTTNPLPNAAADAAGGLPISDAGGLALDTQLAATNEVTAERMGALTDWMNGGRLDLLLDAIPTTAMRGTDSAALASSWTATRAGYVDELAAANIPADVDTLLGRLTAARAALLDEITAVRMATLTDWINGGRLDLLLDAIPTTAMRGTDSAALASVCTEARLSELDAGTAGKAANQIDEIRTDTGEIGTAGAGLTDLGGMSTGMKAEVNTEVDTALITTTYAEPSSVPAATASLKDMLHWLYTLARNKGTQTSTTKTLRNDADGADIATSAVSDDGSQFVRGEWG